MEEWKMKREKKRLIINDQVIEFDFMPGDRVKLKKESCLNNHEEEGTVEKVIGSSVWIEWDAKIPFWRGSKWSVDSVEYASSYLPV